MDVFCTIIDIISVCGSIPIEIPILWPRAVMVRPRPPRTPNAASVIESSPQIICVVATHNPSTCGVNITTDYVAPSFVVLCAPHAAKIPNYSTTSESSIHASRETLTRVKNLAVLPACSKPMLAESHSSVDSVCSVDFAQTRE